MNKWTIDLRDLDLVTRYNLLNIAVLTIATKVATFTPLLVCIGATTTLFTAASEQEVALANAIGFLSPSTGNWLFSTRNQMMYLLHFTFTNVNVVWEEEVAEMKNDGIFGFQQQNLWVVFRVMFSKGNRIRETHFGFVFHTLLNVIYVYPIQVLPSTSSLLKMLMLQKINGKWRTSGRDHQMVVVVRGIWSWRWSKALHHNIKEGFFRHNYRGISCGGGRKLGSINAQTVNLHLPLVWI